MPAEHAGLHRGRISSSMLGKVKLKLKQSRAYATKTRKRPVDVLIAFDEPLPINSVIPYDRWRLRVAEELTREEFDKRMAANQAFPDAVSGNVPVPPAGHRADSAQGEDADAPNESMKHFYAAEVI